MRLDLEKTLNAIRKEVESLVKKLSKMTDGIQKEVQTALKKTQKKAPAKKKAAKKTVKKKAPAGTATQKVLKTISNSKKGVDVSTLMKRTGFSRNQIYNAVKSLKKQGKIKSAGTGIYKKA